MEFKTGDIISAKRPNQIVTHKGIVLIIDDKKYIMHATNSTQNDYGGCLVIEPIETFFSIRRFIKKQSTTLTNDIILNYFEKNKKLKFNHIFQNCEHFVYGCLNNNKGFSPQLIGYSILTISIIILLASLSKKK